MFPEMLDSRIRPRDNIGVGLTRVINSSSNRTLGASGIVAAAEQSKGSWHKKSGHERSDAVSSSQSRTRTPWVSSDPKTERQGRRKER